MKHSKEFFEESKNKEFDKFLDDYMGFITDFNYCMSRCFNYFIQGEEPSKNLLYKMRQMSVDIEKFGKIFREKTIAMDKAKRRNSHAKKIQN